MDSLNSVVVTLASFLFHRLIGSVHEMRDISCIATLSPRDEHQCSTPSQDPVAIEVC